MLRLGRTQRNSQIIKRRRDTARQPHPENIHAEAKIIARSSAEAELSKGIASLLKDLSYEMEPVLAIDAKVIEHILLRQGIG